MKGSKRKIDLAEVTKELDLVSDQIAQNALSAHARRKLRSQAHGIADKLTEILRAVDPVSAPDAFFDPSNPNVMGAVTALALVAQPRRPLQAVADHYGSGIYAIYYSGPFKLYEPISGTETPIYVGQAAPESAGARYPIEQGTRLSRRLKDHRRSVTAAHKTIDIEHFEYRSLVVQSKWEGPAEGFLINLFKPIWNKETKLVFGIGKHGDAPETRGNKRSPWDVIHDSRSWATTADSKSKQAIEESVHEHFVENPPLRSTDDVLEHFLGSLRQFS